jgi:hypothetical protein
MTWAIVPSHPHLEVSDEGLVRSVPFAGAMPNGSPRMYGGGPGGPGVWDPTAKRFCIYSKKSKRNLKIAQLVCEAFHGPAPEDKPYVLHRDEDSRNNRPDNVYWGTQKENLNAPGFLEYCRSRTGENNPLIKGRRRVATE